MSNPQGINQYTQNGVKPRAKKPRGLGRTLSKEAGWAAGDAARAAKKPKISKVLSAAHAKAKATRSFFGT